MQKRRVAGSPVDILHCANEQETDVPTSASIYVARGDKAIEKEGKNKDWRDRIKIDRNVDEQHTDAMSRHVGAH